MNQQPDNTTPSSSSAMATSPRRSMDPRFSFSGSMTKVFKARTTHRRSSNCTGSTVESPDTDEEMNQDVSEEEDSSEEYDSSSEYDSEEEGSSKYSSAEGEEEEQGDENGDLMNDLPIAFAPKAPSTKSMAPQQVRHVIPPEPETRLATQQRQQPQQTAAPSARDFFNLMKNATMASQTSDSLPPLATAEASCPDVSMGDEEGADDEDDSENSSEEDEEDSTDEDAESSSGYSNLMADLPFTGRNQPSRPRMASSGTKPVQQQLPASQQSEKTDGEDADDSGSGYSDLMAGLPIQARGRLLQSTAPKQGRRVVPHMRDDGSDGGFSAERGESDDESESESYSSGSESESGSESGSEYSTDDDEMDTRASGTSYDSSEDWSSSEGTAYNDLLNEMPIGLARPGLPSSSPRPRSPPRQSPFRETKPLIPGSGLPVMTKPGMPVPLAEIPCADPPLEGLAMLQNIRSELEKVGQLIVKNKEGEKFLQRAQILTSINYLASNVPKCVLEDLGREIRDQIKKEEEKKMRATRSKNVMDSLVDIPVDENSDASDLSQMDDGSFASASEGELEDDFFPEAKTPETLRRKFQLENFMPLKNRLSIRDSRALSLSAHSSHFLEPMLREDEGPKRRGASRTYSFASVSSATSTESNWNESNLPIITYFNCALLFVDISGFTKLSTLLDPENLSKVINTYFEVLVSHVSDFNGDIQKFAGDALFAEFRASDECPLPKCAELAAACASALVRDCADFPVSTVCGLLDTDVDGIPAHLNVHCGLGIGEMAGLHIGDNESRWEYMYLGNPIKQTANACDFAQLGEAAASREFCELLKDQGIFEPDFTSDQSAFVIAERANSLLKCNELELLASQKRNARSRGITDHVEGLKPESLKEYRRLMSLYVHPVAVSNDVAAENDFMPCSRGKDKSNSRDRQMEEAELRSVYVMFVNPQVPVEMTGDAKEDSASVEIVHDIMKITNRELRRYNGHMRQFVMDDKGMVMIATFGLRGSSFPNMVGERALPATIALHNAFQYELGIECKIGATFGDVYCGAVGGEKRHEYAVMGPSVNLAARLMANKSNPGILVDNAVRRMASQSFAFNALEPVRAKGYKELVQIFEPLSPVERGWGQIIPNFVGRDGEMTAVTKIALSYTRRGNHSPQMVIVKSSTGMGKSTLLAHSIDRVKKLFMSKRASIGISKYVGRESDSLKPFFAAAQLLRNMLSHFNGCFDDCNSLVSGKDSCYSSMVGSFSADSISFSGESTVMTMSQFADRLEALFIEIGAPTSFLEYTKALLFEDDVKQEELFPELDGTMVTILAAAFRRCSTNLRLSVLAIDDAHQCDEASWLVFQEIFESAESVLFIGTTAATNLADMKINKTFISDLEDNYTKTERYHPIDLGNLSRDEVLQMIMKSMGLQKHDVTDQMIDSVYKQSLGMPLVTNDLIKELKDRADEGSLLLGSKNTDSVADIFLHKIDGFDIKVRDELNVCSLLGSRFVFEDIVSIISEMGDGKKEDIRKECQASFDFLLNEGVLSKVGPEEYGFTHDLWRTIPSGLMLYSRKRDIHRKIAQSLESKVENLKPEDVSLQMHEKIFEHWKATGDTTKSVNCALGLRQVLEKEGNFERCVEVIEEVLMLWGWKPDPSDGRLGGLSKGFLDHVAAEELSSIVIMLVALGTAYTESSRPNIGVIWWENALRIMNSTKSAPEIRDRSVIFIAYNGLSKAIQEGHLVQDVFCRYEQAMIRKYIQETRAHGRLIHHIHALFLQMKLYGRQGDLDKAIAVHSIIKSIYKPEKHSEKLLDVYGQDSGALSFALSAFWETLEGEKKNGLKICRNVLKDLLPRLDRGFFNMFALMFPLTMAFKEAGYPTEAKAFFLKLIVVPYGDCPEDHPLHYLVKIFPAVTALYSAANAKKVSKSDLTEWSTWALNQRSFGQKLQLELGRYGRCADSLTAEVCLLVAQKLDRSDPLRLPLLRQGHDLISEALHFHRKFGMNCAIKPAKTIQARLRSASKQK